MTDPADAIEDAMRHLALADGYLRRVIEHPGDRTPMHMAITEINRAMRPLGWSLVPAKPPRPAA
jgi:hypothetical protein